MLEEIPDPADKRSKRIKITNSGSAVLYSTLSKINNIGDMAFDRQENIEKSILLKLLKKLETFHNKHYREVKELVLESAYERLIVG